jgi:elongation factor 3
MSESHFASLIEALRTAPNVPEAKAASDRVAKEAQKAGLQVLSDQKIIATYHDFSSPKRNGYERESAAVGLKSLATVIGPGVGPLLLPSLSVLFELYNDKGDVVREAATLAVKAIIKLFPPEATTILFRTLEDILKKGKWKAKVGVLDTMRGFADRAKSQIANDLGIILPAVEGALHDTKAEVASAAKKCAITLCNTLANPDLLPHVPALVQCMGNPDSVAACIKAMSGTTFVAEVTAPALAVLVPLLQRALNDRSMEVQRRTVVVIDNLVKLVRDPKVAARYLSGLVDGVEKIMNTASFPEVRAFASSAHATLLKSGASSDATPPTPRDTVSETAIAFGALRSFLPSDLVVSPNGFATPFHPLLSQSLQFSAALVADLAYRRLLKDVGVWQTCVGVYLAPWLSKSTVSSANADVDGRQISENARLHFLTLDRAKYAVPQAEDHSQGEVLCNTLFSLAYGSLLLLSHTTLRLVRGKRYGILAANGSGKSTLLRAIRDGKVEEFPPQDILRAVMVEHALQGEDGSLSVIDFIAADPALKAVKREDISRQLDDVGFDKSRQAEPVGGLSGGWKMKVCPST